MKKQLLRILLAGEGGQGIQTIAEILARAAFREGQKATYIPNFGVEQRGGVSLAFVQLSRQPIVFPKFSQADIMVVLCQRAVERVKNYYQAKTLSLYDSDLVQHSGLGFPATQLAEEQLSPRVFNMIILGALLKIVGIKKESVVKVLEEVLGAKFKKDPQLKTLNLKALDLGEALVQGKIKRIKTYLF